MSEQDPIRLILVDDHKIIIDGLMGMLEGVTHIDIVGTANNGREAIRLIETIQVDVALMDIDMPEMDGIQATKELLPQHPALKIIILSMHDEKALITELMKTGVHGYLLKNSGRDDLVQAIETVSTGKRFFSEDVTMSLVKEDETPVDSNLTVLSEREKEVLVLIAEGLSNKEIGERLFISSRTVEKHRAQVMEKLDAKKVTDLVRIAMRAGLID